MDERDLNVYRYLNKHRVRYVLIGGMAAILYGSPRLTKDTDVLIEPEIENCRKLIAALKAAHFVTASLTTAEKILKNEVNIFKDYVRLDILTEIKGLSFKKAWKNRKIKRIKGVRLSVISLSDLIISKQAVARSIDLEDVTTLKKIAHIKKTVIRIRPHK
ncbi:MAG: nucleotidyltransferase [Candidatus Omnitrophota bacterium]